MNKFKIGDKVYFYDRQMYGEIESIDDDKIYNIITDHGTGGGRFSVSEEYIELATDYNKEDTTK